MGGDGKESLVKALQPAPGPVVGELAPVHLQEVASGCQSLADSLGIRGGGEASNSHRGNLVNLGHMLTRQVELALQIGLDDLHIPQGHADVVVAEQLHQSGKTDTQADHLRGERVP